VKRAAQVLQTTRINMLYKLKQSDALLVAKYLGFYSVDELEDSGIPITTDIIICAGIEITPAHFSIEDKEL